METRITNHLDDFLATIDEKLTGILGASYVSLDAAKRERMQRVFVDAVHEVITLAKQGKNVHERFVQNVVMSAVDAIVGFDTDDMIFFWNNGAENTFGYTKEEMIGRNFGMLLPSGGAYREELRRLNDETYAKGFVRDYHALRQTKDGRVLQISLSRTLIRDEHGQVLGCIAILRDMTEMKALEHQLIQNEKLALLGQIAAGIAHEIGTPLNIISGIAECLLLDRDERHPEREDLDTVIDQTERIADLVRDLLAFARPQPLHIQPVNLNTEFQHAITLLHGNIDKRGIALSMELDPALPDFDADRNQIRQVLLNLIVNASDAMGDVSGDRPRRISAHSGTEAGQGVGEAAPANAEGERGERWVFLRIEDTGSGIDPKILARVFDPFVTTKEIGKGTGLGLAVCRRIVEDHHGTIRAENLAGGGAAFTIRFPATKTQRPE